MNKDYHQILLNAGFKFVSKYELGTFTLEMLVTLPTVRDMILLVYNSLLSRKLIVSIYSLKEEVKNELWTVCKPYTARMGRAEVIEFVKCYWALDKLAEIKEQ